MCAIVDGYRLYRVYDAIGIGHEVAGFGNDDAVERAKARGIKDATHAMWHEAYREYVCMTDPLDRDIHRKEIEDAIWNDLVAY